MSEKFESFMKNNDEFMKIYEKIEELKERVDFLLDSELQAKETDYTITQVLQEFIRWHNDSLFFEGLLVKLSGSCGENIKKIDIYEPWDFNEKLSDSKTSEPKHIRCEDCWFDLCARRIEGFGCNKGRLKKPREDDDYNEWLRSVKETLKEGGYIPVKWEDLQWLMNCVNFWKGECNSIDEPEEPNLTRIKEEYNV